LNGDRAVSGILVQLPLPKHIDEALVTERIDPRKDVDGFHPYNIGRLVLKRRVAPVHALRVHDAAEGDRRGSGRHARGRHRPVEHRRPADGARAADGALHGHHLPFEDARPAGLVRQADIVVAGVGKADFVQGDWVKKGAIVIDVGINRGADGKLCGDVDFAAAAKRAAWITPVPGGVGR
jgi:methylenetetrahydrofolate dehydrogenase (NADP+)/methenyltetrahydrofolate cyclohydrolase